MNTHSLTPEAKIAMEKLWSGQIVVPDESVVQELGRIGLAHRFDLRRFNHRRIVLTDAGAKCRRNEKGQP